MRKIFQTHQKDQRSFLFCQRGIVQHIFFLMAALMPGDHMKGRRIIPMRYRNTRIGRRPVTGGDSWYDFILNTGFQKLLRFLCAPSKDKRIPAF